jgi:hypothetical protein
LRGDKDCNLFSICKGCHKTVHYDEAGEERLWSEWNSILFTKDTRNDYPEVKIDRRKLRENQPQPKEWSRMNAVQRTGWEKERDRQFDLRLQPLIKSDSSYKAHS